ncbi:hypothetical protein GGE07_003094 [Sinorhizobium terangae]|nr:hypothetical protein [Sinorhizobium terangae]
MPARNALGVLIDGRQTDVGPSFQIVIDPFDRILLDQASPAPQH